MQTALRCCPIAYVGHIATFIQLLTFFRITTFEQPERTFQNTRDRPIQKLVSSSPSFPRRSGFEPTRLHQRVKCEALWGTCHLPVLRPSPTTFPGRCAEHCCQSAPDCAPGNAACKQEKNWGWLRWPGEGMRVVGKVWCFQNCLVFGYFSLNAGYKVAVK